MLFINQMLIRQCIQFCLASLSHRKLVVWVNVQSVPTGTGAPVVIWAELLLGSDGIWSVSVCLPKARGASI